MSCPAESYPDVTREVYDCLKRRLAGYGITVPPGDSGTVSSHGFSGTFDFDEGASTLTLTMTKKPDFASCAEIARTLGGAVRACGGGS
ncbi:MAG TPA: hypothetical protein VFX98_14905 [Longimicrobiaceae bacterium]|nr:hypothetical protein [Longimicrobiaceae bacterium]